MSIVTVGKVAKIYAWLANRLNVNFDSLVLEHESPFTIREIKSKSFLIISINDVIKLYSKYEGDRFDEELKKVKTIGVDILDEINVSRFFLERIKHILLIEGIYEFYTSDKNRMTLYEANHSRNEFLRGSTIVS